MAGRRGKCIHFGGCSKADNREVIEVRAGEEFACPECGKPLQSIQEGGGPTPRKKILLVLAGMAVAIGGGLWSLWPGSPQPGTPKGAPAEKRPKEKVAETYPCGLKLASEPDVNRLLTYLKQGIIYASRNQYELALKEFEQVRAADPNFLAMRANVAAAQLKLKKLSEAETNLQEELRLIGCLEQMDDSDLVKFAYMLEVEQKPDSSPDRERARAMRQRLKQARAAAHYNLACIRSIQRAIEQAITELRQAVDSGFSDVSALKRDPDLANARSAPAFEEVLAIASRNAALGGQ